MTMSKILTTAPEVAERLVVTSFAVVQVASVTSAVFGANVKLRSRRVDGFGNEVAIGAEEGLDEHVHVLANGTRLLVSSILQGNTHSCIPESDTRGKVQGHAVGAGRDLNRR